MNGRKLIIEVSRICGWDNAMLTAEIDTDTNAVTYRLNTYQRGVGASEQLFGTFSNAVNALDNFRKTL